MFPFLEISTPEFNAYMLVLYRGNIPRHGHRRSVKLGPQRDTGQFENSRDNVGMRSGVVDRLLLGDTRAADIHGDIDVLFVTCSLAWLQTVLADVVAVVGRIDDVRVVKKVQFFEFGKDSVDQVINRCQRLQSATVVVVEVVHSRLVHPGDILEITGSTRLCAMA